MGLGVLEKMYLSPGNLFMKESTDLIKIKAGIQCTGGNHFDMLVSADDYECTPV